MRSLSANAYCSFFRFINIIGLYFKLHGTHRPNSMKKTVIKRRKRVPAAGGVTTGRMTDQAAAEALVAVGRLGVNANIGGGDDSDGESMEPKKKRARRGRSEKAKRRDEDDVTMEGTEEETERRERPPHTGRPQKRRRSRESNGSNWDSSGPQGENGHGHGINGSPPLDHQQRSHSLSRVQGGDYAHLQRASSHGQFVGSPHPHGGFDLPPLNAALGGGPGNYYAGSLMGGTRDGHYPGAPSSYIRSGSSAPSRTHSPLNPGAAASPAYALHSHGHLSHPYYSQPTGLSPLHSHSPPPHQTHDSINGSGLAPQGIPTYSELKRHYDELHEHRKKLDEMVEKNERMLAAVKRGLDDMRGVPPQQSQNAAGGAPLSDRPRSRASVWPLEPAARD